MYNDSKKTYRRNEILIFLFGATAYSSYGYDNIDIVVNFEDIDDNAIVGNFEDIQLLESACPSLRLS